MEGDVQLFDQALSYKLGVFPLQYLGILAKEGEHTTYCWHDFEKKNSRMEGETS
jgi:hypothetical protein